MTPLREIFSVWAYHPMLRFEVKSRKRLEKRGTMRGALGILTSSGLTASVVLVSISPACTSLGVPIISWMSASLVSPVSTQVKMGDKWRLYSNDPSALLPQVMDYAHSHELRVVSLSTLGPSLEDVFLEITGQQVGVVRHDAREKNTRDTRGRRRGRQ